MSEVIASQPLSFLIALVIGLATAWWIWSQRAAASDEEYYGVEEEDMRLAPLPEPEPDAEPLEVGEESEIAIDPQDDSDDDPYPLATALAATAAGGVAAEAEAAPRPNIAAAVGDDDELTRINGIGPKLQALCHELGVRRFDQIAQWSEADIAEVDGYLGKFSGRIERDHWVEQARLLALGHIAEWEERFGYSG